ncbi:hypothetical protein [Haloarchaeobius amylolyticus]|uniref:hypothetical protein n=1 Tax=Haloarchaeobius amylolyticus TaxID=1198296 RepID=UPI002271E4B0|nr:hypothetical protein [Haloarchaeobius amylolyticus]
MRDSLHRAARERYTPKNVLSFVVAVVVLTALVDDRTVVLALLAAVPILEGAALTREAPGVDGRWAKAGLGALAFLIGLGWLALELHGAGTGDPVWVPALAAATGLWVLLDTRRDFVEGRQPGESEPAEMESDEVLLVLNHTHLVAEALETGPKTVPELAAACDLTESRVRAALDATTTSDTVYRVDDDADPPRYALDESKVGPVAFVRENGRRAVHRLLRPVRW